MTKSDGHEVETYSSFKRRQRIHKNITHHVYQLSKTDFLFFYLFGNNIFSYKRSVEIGGLIYLCKCIYQDLSGKKKVPVLNTDI